MLINGDCIEEMAKLDDASIDIIIADLPYGRFKDLDWDKCIDLDKMWEQIWRISKPTTPVFLFGDFKFCNILMNSQPKWFKYEMVWNKGKNTTPFLSRQQPGRATEYILVFYKKLPVYNIDKYHTSIKRKTDKGTGMGLCGSIQAYKTYNSYSPILPLNIIKCHKVEHKKLIKKITEKPQAVLEHILKYFSNEGDTCLDFTMGSGSCGVACKTLNRNFIGIELKKEHFDVCVERLV